ncbi:DUF6183 family protein [Streptomyces monticola]|uniref:DUF6183 family protein n=1 Tax=Streptomyces monticola TaxID=2666263 RepID=A0ABW2JDU1_9ACTN
MQEDIRGQVAAGSTFGLTDAVEKHAREQNFTYVGDLGDALMERRAEALATLDELQRHLQHLVRVLALTPGRESVAELLRLTDADRTSQGGPRSQLPFLASLLAEAQRPADLAFAFTGDTSSLFSPLRSLLPCLAQELVLRGTDVMALPEIAGWAGHWDRDQAYNPHPLAWLPLRRTGLERDLRFPSRGYRTGAYDGMPQLPADGRRTIGPAAWTGTPVASLREVSTPDLHERMAAAPTAGGWGGFEVKVYEATAPIEPHDLPTVLAGLPAECLEGLEDTSRFEVAPCSAADVWGALFLLASLGAGFGTGVYGAYGRLRAWQSLGGLSGAPAGASWAEVQRRAMSCTWFRFEAESEWFYNEYSDLGIAALAPDGRRIAVLAATTTD